MSQFEVTTTQGHGYVSTNAAIGFKTNESLLDIPQEDTVVTRDLITDLGYASSSDILQFFGLNDLFQGEYFETRGYRIAYAYVDEIPEIVPQEDNVNIDSYEIIKGPAQVLYLAAQLGGVVLKATKKPLPFDQNILTFSVDSWGLWRATVDSTGPIAEIGDAKLSYRLVLANQDGKSYFDNFKDRRVVLFPSLQVDYKSTTVRTNYMYQRLLHTSEGTDLVTPSGELYTGAGRTVANIPRNDLVEYQINRFFAEILHRISDNWEDRFEAGVTAQLTYGPVAFASGGYDWGKQLETFNGRLDNINYTYWTIEDDIQGHYHLGPVKNADAFGFGYSDQTIKQELWTTAWPSPVTVAMNSGAAIDSIPMPVASQFFPPANEGSHQENCNLFDLLAAHDRGHSRLADRGSGMDLVGHHDGQHDECLKPTVVDDDRAFRGIHPSNRGRVQADEGDLALRPEFDRFCPSGERHDAGKRLVAAAPGRHRQRDRI